MHILIKVTNALKGKSAPPSTIGSQALAQKIQEVFYRDFFCTSLHYQWSFSYADFK